MIISKHILEAILDDIKGNGGRHLFNVTHSDYSMLLK